MVYDSNYSYTSGITRLPLPCDGIYCAWGYASGVTAFALVVVADGMPSIIYSIDKSVKFIVSSTGPSDIFFGMQYVASGISADVKVIQLVNKNIGYYYYGRY